MFKRVYKRFDNTTIQLNTYWMFISKEILIINCRVYAKWYSCSSIFGQFSPYKGKKYQTIN